MPSQQRGPSRSVRVPGKASGPVRLDHQPTGSLFAPFRRRAHTDDEMPQVPRGPALLPHESADASHADADPEYTGPAGSSPAEGVPPEKSLAETRPTDVIPANGRPADNRLAEAGQAGANHAGAQPPESSPPAAGPADNGRPDNGRADSGPADGGPAETGQASANSAQAGANPAETKPPETKPSEKDQDKAGQAPESAGLPPRVPARQGPPPKPAPGSAGPGAVPAPRPGGAPATRPGAVPAPRQAAGPPARRPTTQPSWGAVVVTTVRLGVGRRMRKTGWRVLVGLVAAVLLFAAGGLTVALIKGTPASNSPATSQGSGTAQGGIPVAGAGWPPWRRRGSRPPAGWPIRSTPTRTSAVTR